MTTINTADCERCRYGTVIDDNPAKMYVYYGYKDKMYHYGQRIPCEDMIKNG